MTRYEHEVFLGKLPEQVADRYSGSPLVGTYDGHPSAIWNYGDGGPPHMAAWGTTGGGKSSLLRMVGRGLVRDPEPPAIDLIDAEGAGEFNVFRRMPGVASVTNMNPAADRLLPDGATTSVDRAAQTVAAHLALAVELSLERDRAAAAWEAYLVDPAHHQPPVYAVPRHRFLVVDGFRTFCHNLRRYARVKTDTIEDMTQIGVNGRKTNGHLILADQVSYAKRSKDDNGLPAELKKQLGLRVAAVGPLGITASEAQMIFDLADVTVPKDLGGCMMKVGAAMVPFLVPRWLNATDPAAPVSADERRAAFRLLPSPVEGAA